MNNIKEIPVSDIQLSKFNPRRHFDPQKMQDLQDSIKEKGVIVPILVRPLNGKYEMVCGERRLKASQKVGKKIIPSIVSELTDIQVLEFQVIENLQREGLHPLEEAEGYEALLKKHGYKSADDIAVKVGKSRSYVYGRLKLCDLIPENRQLFYKDKFSPSVALLVARVPKDLQKEAGKTVARGRFGQAEPMSYRGAHEYIVNNYTLRLKEAPFDTKDARLGGKVGSCATCQKRTGNQKELFPDISSADVCTDPTCFAMKKNAYVQRTLAQAKEAGKKVLSLDECKKIFRYEHSTDPDSSKYVSLDQTCYEAKGYPKYGRLIKGLKDIEIIYAVQPHKGTLVKLVEKAALGKALKTAGVKLDDGGNSKWRQDQAKARREERIRKIIVGKIAEAIIVHARRDTKMSYLRHMAQAVVRASNEATQRLFILRRDSSLKRGQIYDKVKEHLKAISDSELLGFCLELLMLSEAEWRGYGDAAVALSKHYKIDIKKIQASVKKEFEAKRRKNKVSN